LKAYFFVILLLLVIFGGIGSYKYAQISALASMSFERPPVTIAASVVSTETWSDYLNAVGTIKAARGIRLTSEESGEIIRINFDSGDSVQSQQLMVVLNDKVEAARRESQQATLALAKLQFARNRELLEKKSVSRSDFDRSQADLERAYADLAETEAILANKRIRAPFAGTAGIRQIDLGDFVSPGTVLASLQDLSELEIDFTLPAQSAPLLEADQRIEVEVDAFPGQLFQARLAAIDSLVDVSTRNLQARAKILGGQGLLPGMFAYLKIFPGSDKEAITVPETAISYSLHGNTIYRIDTEEDGTLRAASIIVEVGETRNGRTDVLKGIEPGDRVVTAGQNKLYRGARVSVDEKIEF
jgi:membrane fusion protein, multidrug efflux system